MSVLLPLTGCCNVSQWVHPVELNHEIAIFLVSFWRLAGINASEKFRQGLSLNVSDRVHIKPVCRHGWNSERLRLHCRIVGTIHIIV